MTADLVCQALQMALWRRKMPKGVILHSDRGSQYCSATYQSLMMKHQLGCSMSAQDNCYDTACVESCFHIMKVDDERFAIREEMGYTVFEYLDVDDNHTHRHSAKGRISPMAFLSSQSSLTGCPLNTGRISNRVTRRVPLTIR